MALFTILRRFPTRNLSCNTILVAIDSKKRISVSSIVATRKRCYAKPANDENFRNMTKAEWEERLTRQQFLVCREQCTEPPFSGQYNTHYDPGIYHCVCCGAELFSSKDKFNPGTGWPSFKAAFKSDKGQNVIERQDNSHGMLRIEVICRKCDSHLGHVFDDGPEPSGKRYCINSVALKFTLESQ